MNDQSPANGFWLPSPQYSESGWIQGSPEMDADYFHAHQIPGPSPMKAYESQHYQNGPTAPHNMTPGLTPQSQSLPWQGPYQPDHQSHLQSHPSLSGSFMQQFDSANIEDPFIDAHNIDPLTPSFPLQTPPPTRESRRKPQQPRLPEFATPPTIRKRPLTANSGRAGPAMSPDLYRHNTDASPFPFTPLQFSPPPGFVPSGPMTAPAQHGNVFWDSQHFSDFEPTFPTIAEDPFSSTPAPAAQHFSFSSPVPLIHHRYATSESYPGPPIHPHMRPQTTRPATAAPMHSIPAGIDPNVLRANQSFRGQPETFRPTVAAPSTPYATQKAALQREKSARAKRTAARPDIRRANTDSTVSRSESPLKRQRSNANPPMGTFTTTPRRRELVMTVDDYGYASAKIIGEPLPPGSYSLAVTDEEESGDDVEGIISAASDAQSAIKELRKR